jgi:hypothetical protein
MMRPPPDGAGFFYFFDLAGLACSASCPKHRKTPDFWAFYEKAVPHHTERRFSARLELLA